MFHVQGKSLMVNSITPYIVLFGTIFIGLITSLINQGD